ncbi:MAG: protein-disulfide reductase DsbD domain-containing protein [Bryobacteraceae bacterium]
MLLWTALYAQNSPVLTVTPPSPAIVKRGAGADVKLAASLNEGFHANSNTPAESYLIPLTLTWAPGPLEIVNVQYPKPQMQKYEFSEKPLSVVTGKFEILTKFKAAPNARAGPGTVTGKLRYQACNDKACFPPKTVEVKLPIEIQ